MGTPRATPSRWPKLLISQGASLVSKKNQQQDLCVGGTLCPETNGFLIQRLSDVQIDARVSDGQRADTNCGFVLTGNTENYIGTVPLREPDCDRNSGRFLTMWQRCTCVVVEKGC